MNNKKFRKLIIEEKKAMIGVVFSLFDEDSDGFMDYEELKSALKAMGFPTKKLEVIKILETYDKKAHKSIGFDDFKTVVIDKIMRCNPVEEIEYAFKLMCNKNQEVIGFSELKRITELIGIEIDTGDIKSMISEFDIDGDSAINLEEFLKIMLSEDEN